MNLVPSRNTGPLGQLQTEADALKINVQEIIGITSKWNYDTADNPQVESCYKNCLAYLDKIEGLLEKANKLQLHDEPNLPTNFDQKKSDEIKRLQSFKQKLTQQMQDMDKLPNSQFLKIMREGMKKDESPKVSFAERESESIDEDEKSDYDDDIEADLYVVIHDFTAQEKGDLSVKTGEVLDILTQQDDGWWMAENEEGDRGMVPSNFLRVDVDDEAEEKSEVMKEEEDQDVEGDARTQSDFQTEPPSDTKSSSVSSPKMLWKEIRDSVTEHSKIDVTDVLGAMGALPAGFRPSMLEKLQENRERYSLQSVILPPLTQSKLTYSDLIWDSASNSVRPITTRVLRTFKIWRCIQIPVPGTGVEVLSRHIRYALFDGSRIVSNIMVVRAYTQPSRQKMWMFSSKSKDGTLLPSLQRANGIIRSNNEHSNLGILFELGATYVRNPPKRVIRYSDGVACEYSDDDEEGQTRNRIRQTGEKGELSCGWCHLKLFDEQSNRIPNRTYELAIHGGTPFEQAVELDPSIMRRAAASRFRSLMIANKMPRLIVQIGEPAAVKRKYLNLLPPTIVIPSSYGRLLSLFRGVLAEGLLCNRSNPSDASLVHSPVISAFLQVVNQADIMDALLHNWTEKEKLMSRGEKKDEIFLTNMFKSVVMEAAYPLLHVTSLPEPRWANQQAEEARNRFVSQLTLSTSQQKGVLKHFLTSNYDMEPFDIAELTFDPLRHAATVA